MSQKVSPKKLKAIQALLSEPTIEEAAKKAGVHRRTLTRWMSEDEDFQQALLDVEGQAIDRAARRLISLQDNAIRALEETLKSAKGHVRLRAAEGVLDYLLRLRELRNVEARLSDLEEAVSAINKSHQ